MIHLYTFNISMQTIWILSYVTYGAINPSFMLSSDVEWCFFFCHGNEKCTVFLAFILLSVIKCYFRLKHGHVVCRDIKIMKKICKYLAQSRKFWLYKKAFLFIWLLSKKRTEAFNKKKHSLFYSSECDFRSLFARLFYPIFTRITNIFARKF